MRLADEGCEDVAPDVFRANLVFAPISAHDDDFGSGGDSNGGDALLPYAEDGWSGVRMGEGGLNFEMLGACRRCHMVCVNQETGERGVEPFVTLAKTRRFDGKVFFGVHMCYSGGEGGRVPTVRVGDVVVPE